MDTYEAILSRRSIRKYKSDPIPDELLHNVLNAARWAPSWANTQAWEFIVVRDQEIKKQLVECLTPRNPATKGCLAAPLLIISAIHKQKSGFYNEQPVTSNGDYAMFDLGLAMQNLSLAAHSFGLATVHVAAMNVEKMAKILGLKDGMAIVSLTPLGFPDQAPGGPDRKELSDIVSYNQYGQRSF